MQEAVEVYSTSALEDLDNGKRPSSTSTGTGINFRQWRLCKVLFYSAIVCLLLLQLNYYFWQTHAEPFAYHLHGKNLGSTTSLREHPIPSLIDAAQQRWDSMFASQSRSLGDAIKEYQRRYNRRPPKGFDIWFRWALDNGVHFVDEYDQINSDLELFWHISPSELADRIRTQITEIGYISSVDGQLFAKDVANAGMQNSLDGLLNLGNMFPGSFSDFTLPIYHHDKGTVFVTWEERQKMMGFDTSHYIPKELHDWDRGFAMWSMTCPPDSYARQYTVNDGVPSWTTHPEVIVGESYPFAGFVDHEEASDACNNPQVAYMHGAFLERPSFTNRPLTPLASWSTFSHSAAIRIPVMARFEERLSGIRDWSEKTGTKLFWRGSTTGMSNQPQFDWRQMHRFRMAQKAQANTGWSTVFRPYFVNGSSTMQEGLEPSAVLAKQFLDIGITSITQCGQEVCETMANELVKHPYAPLEELTNHKFLWDSDGNGWSARFRTLLRTGGVVIKSTIYPEWFSGTLIPWYHYVPSRIDYDDIYSILAYFTADEERDEQAARIAANGKEYAAKYWRKEDMASYLIRLFLEWSRLTAKDRASMDL